MGKRGKRRKQQLRAARRAAGRHKSANQLMLKLAFVGLAMNGLSALFAGGQFLFGDNVVRQLTQPKASEITEVRKEQPPVSRVLSTPQTQLQITSPANNSTFSYGSTPTVSATAISRNSRIAKMGFYAGTNLIGSIPSSR